MGNRDYYRNPNDNPYRVRKNQPTSIQRQPGSPRAPIDFDIHRICPACGKIIKLSHNFCKFCGQDISSITPVGRSDEVTRTLAATAISDPSAEVRKEAVDSLGEFGEFEVLGVLAYIVLNDPDENVRKAAVDELGILHHPHSLDILAKAIKDKSPLVRKEAIEGLKEIKKMTKKRNSMEQRPQEKAVEVESQVEEIPIIEAEEEEPPQDKPSEDVEVEKEPEEENLDNNSPENKDYYKL